MSPPAVLDGIAEHFGRRRFADDAVVNLAPARREPVHDLDGAVHRRAFLVRGDEQADGALVLRMRGHEGFGGGDERRDRALHVGGAAAVEHAVAHLRLERVAMPILARTGRHDISVTGEHHHRLAVAAFGPEIVDVAVAQVLAAEARGREALREDFLAAGVVRRHRWTPD